MAHADKNAETTSAEEGRKRGGGVRRGGVRQLVESLVCLAVAVILFRAFEVEGYMISTGSMAPTLLGYHKRVTCPTCGYQFAFGIADDEAASAADNRTPPGEEPNDRVDSNPRYGAGPPAGNQQRSDSRRVLSTCPNCGQDSIQVSRVPPNQGDQLLVHKHAYSFQPPRRWEVVVFRNPYKPTQAYVKRVVGVPGESVQIVDGDIYVNGKIARKDWTSQRAMRILVSDHDHQPAGDPDWQPRWTPEALENPWQPDGHGFVLEGTPDRDGQEASQAAWVAYQHRSRSGNVAPVTDFYGYNRPNGEGNANAVADLIVSARLTIQRGRGEFLVEMTDAQRKYQCVLDAARQEVRLLVEGRESPVSSAPLSIDLTKGPVVVEMSLVDRQVLIAVDGRPALPPLKLPSGRREQPVLAAESPVRFGARELQVRVDSLKVFRDVYYTHGRANNGVNAPYKLEEGEYFVLGDNSPVSSDSRSWPDGRVNQRLLLGKPFLVHLPSRPGKLTVGKWIAHIRIPDVSRIRYIR